MGKSMLVGVLLAILVVAAAGLGGYAYLSTVGGSADVHQQERVVLIFEAPAEDGATVAALVSVVTDGRMRDVSPDTTVTIPGTSFSQLRDAFVFGGGASVARALGDSGSGGPTAFVSVPSATWRVAVESTQGVAVNVPHSVAVFDGTQLTAIRSGEQTLTAPEVAALLKGLSYVSAEESAALRRELEWQLAAALVATRPQGNRLETDLSADALDSWLQNYLLKVAIPQVE